LGKLLVFGGLHELGEGVMIDYLVAGGPVMIPIVLCSVLSLALIEPDADCQSDSHDDFIA